MITLKDGPLYFDESYSSLVYIEGGRPVRYAARWRPTSVAEQDALIARIEAKTGFLVRFGEWVEDPPGDPRDAGFTVELTVVPV